MRSSMGSYIRLRSHMVRILTSPAKYSTFHKVLKLTDWITSLLIIFMIFGGKNSKEENSPPRPGNILAGPIAYLIRLCGKTALQYLVGYLSLTIPLFSTVHSLPPPPPEVGTRVLFCVFCVFCAFDAFMVRTSNL